MVSVHIVQGYYNTFGCLDLPSHTIPKLLMLSLLSYFRPFLGAETDYADSLSAFLALLLRLYVAISISSVAVVGTILSLTILA